MTPDKAAPAQLAEAQSERFFTVTSARKALVFVRRVVQDIVTHYDRLMRLRAEREELALTAAGSERLEDIRGEIAMAADRLRLLHEELAEVGCELKDSVVGLVDFPAMHQGRKVWLCWKLGDPDLLYWHDLYAGFAGRQPLPPDFDD